MGTFKKPEKEEGQDAQLGIVPSVAAPSSTFVPVRLERTVMEKHSLPANFSNATEKIELAKKCNEELWAIPEKSREKLLKQMGYGKDQIKYYMGGLDYFSSNNAAAITQVEALARNGAKVEDQALRDAMAKSANAIAGSILVAFTPYILWKAKKGGNEAIKQLVQLEDAHSYVAYTQMFNLYNMKNDMNGSPRYVANVNEGLESRYYRLLELFPFASKPETMDSYRKAADDFYKYYSQYSQKQMAEFQGKKEIGEARGFEKAYLVANPYMEASFPVLMSALMATGGPGGFALGAFYFGNQAVDSFKAGQYLSGSLVSLTLMAPFFSALRAVPMAVARTTGTVGAIASKGAGLAFQVGMAKDAFGIVFDAARMGWTRQDATALLGISGFAAMPAAVRKAAGPGEGTVPSKKPLSEAFWAAHDQVRDWFDRKRLQMELFSSPGQVSKAVQGSIVPVTRLTGQTGEEKTQQNFINAMLGAKPKTQRELSKYDLHLQGEGKDAVLSVLLSTDSMGTATVVFFDGSTGKFDKKQPAYASVKQAMALKGRGGQRYRFTDATAKDIDILKQTLVKYASEAPELTAYLAAHRELAVGEAGTIKAETPQKETAVSEWTVETPTGAHKLKDVGREPRGEIYRNDAAADFGLTLTMGAKIPQQQLRKMRAFHAGEMFPPWEGSGGWDKIEQSAAKENIDLDARLKGSTLVNLGAGRESLKSFLEFAYKHGVKTCVLNDIDLPSKADIKTLMDGLPGELRRNMGIVFVEADLLDVLGGLKDGSVNIAMSRVMGSQDTAVREGLGASQNPEPFFAEVGKEMTRVVGDRGVAFGMSPQAFGHLGGTWDARGGSGFAVAVKKTEPPAVQNEPLGIEQFQQYAGSPSERGRMEKAGTVAKGFYEMKDPQSTTSFKPVHAKKLYEYLFPNDDEREPWDEAIVPRIDDMKQLPQSKELQGKYGDSRFHAIVATDGDGNVVGYTQFSTMPLEGKKVVVFWQYGGVADESFMNQEYGKSGTYREQGVASAFYVFRHGIAAQDAKAMGYDNGVAGTILEAEFIGQGDNPSDIRFTKTRLGIHRQMGAKAMMLQMPDGSLVTTHFQPRLTADSNPILLHLMFRPLNYDETKGKETEVMDKGLARSLAMSFIDNFDREGFDKDDVQAARQTVSARFDQATGVLLVPPENLPDICELANSDPLLKKQVENDYGSVKKQETKIKKALATPGKKPGKRLGS